MGDTNEILQGHVAPITPGLGAHLIDSFDLLGLCRGRGNARRNHDACPDPDTAYFLRANPPAAGADLCPAATKPADREAPGGPRSGKRRRPCLRPERIPI